MPPICKFTLLQDVVQSGTARRLNLAKSFIAKTNSKYSEGVVLGNHTHQLPNLIFACGNSSDRKDGATRNDSDPYDISNLNSQYPPRFRIPPATIKDLSKEECMQRSVQFALGSLLYEVMTGEPPFADVDDSVVQRNFERGVYPEKTTEFPLDIAIQMLGWWSAEFAQECE